ncbi:MAG: chromate efflux transporter [Flavobacteriales bacterium]|nr:chromate efflux transporter [Bacteroidota bacterium]MCB9240112.1 chromate efflux transporter [Flavobacteriales bacterium]
MSKTGSKVKKIKRLLFLKDVLAIALTAFGGPEMHLAMFQKRMVERRKYLTSPELLELYGLAQMLPGPSSTQTITAMGYKFGGAFLAFLTLIVWILPAFILMTILSFSLSFFHGLNKDIFRFIQPLAVAFVLTAGVSMARKVNKGRLRLVLMLMAFVVAALLRHRLEDYVKTPWIFPVLLIGGGIISYFLNKKDSELIGPSAFDGHFRINWQLPAFFFLIFILAGLAARFAGDDPTGRLIILFENTYRFGALVFGGGNVLIPMMLEQFVQFNNWITPDDFLTGIGMNQAVPGPIFTITSYCGGMIMQADGPWWQLGGAVVGTIGIFLPGTLMIFFIFPVWNRIKKYKIIKRSLDGVVAASSGLVLAAGYLLFLSVGFKWKEPNSYHFTNLEPENFIQYDNVILVLILSLLLTKFKVPAPVWVLLAIIAGIIF